MLVIARQPGLCRSRRRSASRCGPNPKYRPASAEQIVDDFRRYIAQMQPKLPELFGYIPGSPVTVEAIPDFQAAVATHYQIGTADGTRPGRVVVATSNFAERSLINDEAIAYHEGIPGHHMQLSVAQLMKGLPKFRLHVQTRGTPKAGRCTPSSSARRWVFIRTRSATMAGCPANCSAPCAWSSTPAFIRRDGAATRSSSSCAGRAPSTSQRSRRRPTATSPGLPRRWLTSSVN